VLEHLQLNAVPGGRVVSGFAGVTPGRRGKFHMVSGHPLHRYGELLHLGAVLLEASGTDPVPRLLVHHPPRGKIVRHQVNVIAP
jgi:hypothetical protein